MSKIKTELVTFAKAELTASIASVVDFGLAFILSDVICIYYGLANAIGVMAVASTIATSSATPIAGSAAWLGGIL